MIRSRLIKLILLSDGTIVPPVPPEDFDILSETESEITFWYNGEWVTYGIVDGQNGTKWLDRNLGASRVATAIDDELSYGDVYQWGRYKDGHESRTSNTTSTISSTSTPGHGDFIVSTSSPRDWIAPQNDELWQGTINTPAPEGWRVPTILDFFDERDSWSEPTSAEALASPLKLPSAGGRENGGAFGGAGSSGAYWTSTPAGTNAGVLIFSLDGKNLMTDIFRAFALPIRLIKSHKIGDIGPGGGIVFYDKGYYSDWWRYLEVHKTDVSSSAKWQDPSAQIGSSGVHPYRKTEIGSGLENTNAIVTWLDDNSQTGRAAQLCNDLDSGGKQDWFLPSKDELNQCFLQRNIIAEKGGEFVVGYYWTSTEETDTFAWVQGFNSGLQYANYDKAGSNRVRPIRRF